jgi:hypothetical protein
MKFSETPNTYQPPYEISLENPAYRREMIVTKGKYIGIRVKKSGTPNIGPLTVKS